jgi:hypothetical protein
MQEAAVLKNHIFGISCLSQAIMHSKNGVLVIKRVKKELNKSIQR